MEKITNILVGLYTCKVYLDYFIHQKEIILNLMNEVSTNYQYEYFGRFI